MVVLKKDGFETQTIMLNDLFKSSVELSVTMQVKEDLLEYKKIDKTVNDLFESQRLMRSQQFDDAIELLKNLEKD